MNISETVGEAVKSLRIKTKHSSWWSKWFWYMLAGLLGLALISAIVVESLYKSKKAAKALHTRDVLLEEKARASVDRLVATSEKKRQKLLVKAEKYTKKAEEKLEQNKVLTAKVAKNQKIIDGLRSWDDVKKSVKYTSST